MRIIKFWETKKSILTTAKKRLALWLRPGGIKIVSLAAGEIVQATHGELLFGDPHLKAEGVASDSRQVRPGQFFIPLKGPRFDGHDFIGEAIAKGAAGSLVQRGQEKSTAGLNTQGKFFVMVGDVLTALGDLAHFWRRRHSGKVVAITGSNGKTTTKEMAARVLAEKFDVLRTEGNLNNLIGLPLMLLRLSPAHDVAVLEMGTSGLGEIRRLKEIAEPQVSLITNIGRAHLEFLGSLEGVARAKGELWEGLKAEDWIAVNTDEPRVAELAFRVQCRKKTFGILGKADIRGEDLSPDDGRGIRFSLMIGRMKRSVILPAFGRHNVTNALAAAALGEILGVDIERIVAGLEAFQPHPGRGKVIRLPRDVNILDDSYNANPDSLRATLSAFVEMKGETRGILVMGDMLEIGPGSAEEHERAGKGIGTMDFEHVFFLGEKAQNLTEGSLSSGMEEQKVHSFQTHEEILKDLEKVIKRGDWILVKGSRGMHMERIIEGLQNRLAEL